MSQAEPLQDRLRQALREQPDGALCVSFSGGPDSTALLHALASLPEARERHLRAIHIDHGLHPDSALWADQAHTFCSALEVPCTVVRVHVARSGEGLEAAARHARYATLGSMLHPGEWLLLGHHRDDQAETVLLKLLRGAGPEGLGGMRPMRSLGHGTLWRPMLDVPREMLRDHIARHGLSCIHDPSNDDRRLSRNRLRHDILPALQTHWPHAVDSINHSASLSRAAADALRIQWLDALRKLENPDDGSLDAPGWLALEPALRHPLLDHWLHQRDLRAPTSAQRAQIERQARDALPGTTPLIHWPGTDLHIWKQRLWARAPHPAIDPTWTCTWSGETIDLPGGGRLGFSGASQGFRLQVRLRRGGERLRPLGHAHTRELRDLFQQASMPPWQRAVCPLIFQDGELLAVADRWRTARADALFGASHGLPVWQPMD